MTAKMADHKVRIHCTLVTSNVIKPNENGDVVVVEEEGEEVIDFIESRLVCDSCGILGYDELEDHAISENWQEA